MCQAFFLGAREVTGSIVPSSMEFPVQRMIQRSEHTVIISVLSAVLDRGNTECHRAQRRVPSPNSGKQEGIPQKEIQSREVSGNERHGGVMPSLQKEFASLLNSVGQSFMSFKQANRIH